MWIKCDLYFVCMMKCRNTCREIESLYIVLKGTNRNS